MKILVPLDGSALSDRILPAARALALDGEGDHTLTLLRVMPPHDRPPEERAEWRGAGEPSLALRREAADRHLAQLAEDLGGGGLTVTGHVDVGDPAEAILARAVGLQPELVAMSTHGRTGVARWVRGSVAERVLRRCPVPLYLENPHRGEGVADPDAVEQILVPLDGSPWSTRVLPLVERFARTRGATVTLLQVVYVPHKTELSLPEALQVTHDPRAAASFLEEQRESLAAAGVETRHRVVHGDPAIEIVRTVDEGSYDLVAMSTHGRTGLVRWAFGSVAEKVLRHCDRPLLVRRVSEADD